MSTGKSCDIDTDQHNLIVNHILIYSNSEDESELDKNKSNNDDIEFNKNFKFDNIYEDYLVLAFELPSHDDIFTDSRFM